MQSTIVTVQGKPLVIFNIKAYYQQMTFFYFYIIIYSTLYKHSL